MFTPVAVPPEATAAIVPVFEKLKMDLVSQPFDPTRVDVPAAWNPIAAPSDSVLAKI